MCDMDAVEEAKAHRIFPGLSLPLSNRSPMVRVFLVVQMPDTSH
jgi:hypothetical protein